MTPTASSVERTCRNCGAQLAGEFCHLCGQKRLSDRDRTLGHLLGEAFQQVTDVDGRLLRSLRLLLFAPGLLSREYLDDRRVRYSSPLSLFLLANVLYFFAPALSDFNLPFVEQVPGAIALGALDPAAPDSAELGRELAHSAGQMHSPWTAPLVERKLAGRKAIEPGYDLRQLADDYDHEAGIVGKVLMIVHVPILAFALGLAFVRKRRFFVEHFVVALHLFTFLLLFMQLVVAPMHWLSTRFAIELPPMLGVALKLTLTFLVFFYFVRACRVAYRCGWAAAIGALLAALVGLWFANLWVYRSLQFLITLALI